MLSKNLLPLSTLIVLACFFTNCSNKRILPPTPEAVYEKYRDAVVLIRHSYYYRIDFDNNLSCYASNVNGNTTIFYDENEAKEHITTSYGTGFFVSKEGDIVTNRHVVEPKIDESLTDSLNNLRTLLNALSHYLWDNAEKSNDTVGAIRRYLTENGYALSYSQIQDLNDEENRLLERARGLQEMARKLVVPGNKAKVMLLTTFLGVAYNGSQVSNTDDYNECVVMKTLPNTLTDLAVIQLKTKKTPNNIVNVFSLDNQNPNFVNHSTISEDSFDLQKPLKINTDVYMIGFNYGYELAKTANGIKSQFTKGTVSQESDDSKVLYSVPALEGSSGSPIIDKWGNLVAVNFAKLSNTQSFSFGIPAKHLKELFEDGYYQEPIMTIALNDYPIGDPSFLPVTKKEETSDDLLAFDVILNSYADLEKAKRRMANLKSYGNVVKLLKVEEESVYYVTMHFENVSPLDTARLLDSLKETFNPTYGVRIID